MFERYTEGAKATIFGARLIATRVGYPRIGTEHLLIGLLRTDKRLANRFLGSPWAAETIWKKVEQKRPIREALSGPQEIPLSESSKRTLYSALEEANSSSSLRVGTQHLLLGLLREEKSLAAEVLSEIGIDLATTRDQLSRVLHDDSEQEVFIRERGPLSPEVIELEERVKAARARVEEAISENDFDKARAASDEEGAEGRKLIALYREHGLLDWIYL